MKTFRIFSLVVLAFAIAACTDDDNNNSNSHALTFSIPVGYDDTELERWIFVSDSAGNVLDIKQVQNGDTYWFDPASDYTADNVTFTIMQSVLPATGADPLPVYTLDTYMNVPWGAYGYYLTPRKGNGGTSNVTIADITAETFNRYSVPARRGYSIVPSVQAGKGLNLRVTTKGDNSSLLVMQDIWSAPDQYLYQEIAPGKDYVKTTADFKEVQEQTILLPYNTNVSVLSMTGSNDRGDIEYYSNGEYIYDEKISVPVIPDVFNTTAVHLEWWNAGNSHRVEYFSKGKTPSNSARLLDVTLSFSAEENDLVSITTGISDVVTHYAWGWTSESSYEKWNINIAGGNRTAKLPVIPQVLVDKYKLIRFSDLQVPDYVSVTDYMDYDTYQEFLKGTLSPQGPTYTEFARIRF